MTARQNRLCKAALPHVSASSCRRTTCRFYSSVRNALPMFPIVEVCPSATCKCAATPIFPDGYELDRKGKLNGVMAAYAEQVLICTGQDDWASKIEEEQGGNNLAADLKTLFGRGGLYSDVSLNLIHLQKSIKNSKWLTCAWIISSRIIMLPL